ncbi:MAG: hypothetical protein KBE23_06435 [Chloroflexi bacterium]|nr:hypothetical protein [Chloroflexota bacterium]MBP7042362.1 hypothetical protein [Chloroflexota bacterium]
MDWGVITVTATELLAWIGLGSVILGASIALAFLVAWLADRMPGNR